MADPFIGEIRLFGFNRIPDGWLACDGRAISIAQYEVLFTLIGTNFGGDGVNTFGLPDLRGRVPISQGQAGVSNSVVGQASGEEQHTLVDREMPQHSHALVSSTDTANTPTPSPSVHLATASTGTLYAPVANVAPYAVMSPTAVQIAGNSFPHDNMMPTLVGNFCICFSGIYPSRP